MFVFLCVIDEVTEAQNLALWPSHRVRDPALKQCFLTRTMQVFMEGSDYKNCKQAHLCLGCQIHRHTCSFCKGKVGNDSIISNIQD